MSNSSSKPNNKESRRKRKIYLLNIVSVLIVLCAIVWGLIVFFHFNESIYTNDAQIDGHISPINAKVGGYIQEVRVKEHEHVQKGDTLLLLDDREYNIQLKNALAALADAKAGRTVTQTDVQLANNNEQIADANLEELRTRLENAEANYRRFKTLMDQDAIAVYQYEEVKTEYEALLAKYKALQTQKSSTKLSSRQNTQRTAIDEAGILRAQAAVDLARLHLSYTVIVAPFDGIVGRVTLEDGQLIQSGQNLFQIVREQQKWVTANYTENQLKEVSIGKKVVVKVDALPDLTLEGEIIAISEATGSRYASIPVDNAAGNFIKVQQRIPVRINFTSKNRAVDLKKLIVGMNVSVKEI